ncbi:MAG: ABC transporter ATP-binding protein [Lachnospiraceae bacterium]|nr:ABC transporter ATP-binding protein [Lachnospiraceae bacterium]
MNILVKAEHISKDYQLGEVTVHALKDVSFEIYEKELIVILGPSGSGKSTTLNILGGIETATTGNVYYAGIPLDWRDPAVLTAYRRDHIGFIFQFYNLLPGLTALENIALSAELSKSPLDPSRLIEEVGLGDRRDHFPNRLSGGEQQRIAIARALCKNPDLLLCDEPTGALDSATGIQVLKLIEQFCREYEKTVILITHNQDIAKIADRVFHFRDGRIERIMDNPHPIKPEDLHW